MLSQTCIHLFIVLNTKEDILKNVGNQTVCFICILCVSSHFLITDKLMTNIFIFTHYGLNIRHSFLYFVTLKVFVIIIGTLVWL